MGGAVGWFCKFVGGRELPNICIGAGGAVGVFCSALGAIDGVEMLRGITFLCGKNGAGGAVGGCCWAGGTMG